ncbi:MAG: hypothetical protein ACI841_003562 [Planctomycetota bacterium]|jgi:hypothetical protein
MDNIEKVTERWVLPKSGGGASMMDFGPCAVTAPLRARS